MVSMTRTPSDLSPLGAGAQPRSSFVMPALGLAAGLDRACLEGLQALMSERRPVPRGAALFHQGDALTALYEVHAGLFKTCLSDEQGRTQVTGFHMSGDLLGLDGIGADHHGADAVALEDALVCVIPFEPLSTLFREFAPLQHEFHRIMSREIMRDQNMMLVLGTLAAEGRVAAFVLDLTERLHARGYSASSLLLRMTREEIGSYLGLQLETVSRTFSRLQQQGLLEIHNREVQVKDPEALRRLVHGPG